MVVNPPDHLRQLSDHQWYELLVQSVHERDIDGVTFPGFPDTAIQTRFVGSSDQTALSEALKFYIYLKKMAWKTGNPLNRHSRVLDFGCGWGRFLRFFWKDVDVENIYGCDINNSILESCRELDVPGEISRIFNGGTLPYPDASFDVAMSYSVFTHLPEKLHLHWMQELARVLKPGGMFILTLEPERFLKYINNLPENTDSEWLRMLNRHKPRIADDIKACKRGELVFLPTIEGAEDSYGDTVVPLGFIRQHWGKHFSIVKYLDNRWRFWQAVLTVTRR